MRKFLYSFIFLIILISFGGLTNVQASGWLNKTQNLQQEQLPNLFTFEQLGYAEKLMVGPFDSTSISFSLPANIHVAPGSSLTLQYALAWSGGGDSSTTSQGTGVGGTLLVYFNDELIDTIVLSSDGPPEIEVAIPDNVLNKVREDGRYNIRFFLDAEVNCGFNNVRTTLTISKNSLLNLQYQVVAPPADLTLFPRPIYQPDSILRSSAIVVVPDNPEDYELRAALTVMAGLGAVSEGNLQTTFITNNSLTQEMVSSNHLIFVGLAKSFPNLEAVNFPVRLSGEGLVLDKSNEGNGVVQVAQSPWSQASVVMFVGGNSQDGVTKASQAFSTGKLIAVEKPDVSLIANVNPIEASSSLDDQTLQSLGYDDQILGLYGESYYAYHFYASPEQATSEGAYLDLVMSHSDLLDLDQTGLTVLLNGEVVGGLQISQDSPEVKRINLIPGVLRRGMNLIEIISNIVPRYTCYPSNLLSTWITISKTSNIHLPVSQNKLGVGLNFNLKDFPYMFLDSRDMGDVAFILPSGDFTSWNNAAQVAFFLGTKGGVPMVNFQAMVVDTIPDDALKSYSFLIFGEAGALPFMQKINDLLPAPYDSSTGEAVQPSMLINYSLLPNTSVGYLQLIPSPWNPDRAILSVSGNNLAGVPMAGATLIKDDLISRLAGNFAVLYQDQVVSTDTRLGVSKESVISQLPVAVTVTPTVDVSIPAAPVASQIESRPTWIPPLIIGVTIGILVLVGVMIRKEAIARKKPKEARSAREDITTDPRSK